MPNLRILTLFSDQADHYRINSFRWLTKTLETLTSKLEEINLVVNLIILEISPNLWTEAHWASRFDAALTSDKFSQLRRVNLILNSPPLEKREYDLLKSQAALRLPLLYKKGWLAVTANKDWEGFGESEMQITQDISDAFFALPPRA